MKLSDQILGPPHSPTTCQASGGKVMLAGFAAGLTGQLVEPDLNCGCPCRGCQRGECRLSGAPPLAPKQRERAVEEAKVRQRKRWATQKVFESFDMPPERAPESYRFKVEILHAEWPVDTYYTDNQDAADRLVGAGLRNDGIVWQRDVFCPGARLEFVPPVDGRYGVTFWSRGVYVYEMGPVDLFAGQTMWLDP